MSQKVEERKRDRKAGGCAGPRETAVPVVMVLDEMPLVSVEWLWPERIVSGNLTLLAGDPDVGKSFMALDLAARVTRGAPWPDGEANGKPGGVVLLSAEDHLLYTVLPAMKEAGANLAKVHSLWEVQVTRGDKKFARPFSLNRDIDLLAAVVEQQKDCKLIVIDPISAYVGDGGSARRALFKLTRLAAKYKVAVLAVTHIKGGGADALQRPVGGIAVTAAPRAVWMVVRDPADEKRRLFLRVKNNLTDQGQGMAFRLAKHEGEQTPRVEWSSLAVETTANEALGVLKGGQACESQKCRVAMDFLRQVLADGPQLVKQVEAIAREEGIRHDTLKRARKGLRIVPVRDKAPGPWSMRLPTPDELGDAAQQDDAVQKDDTAQKREPPLPPVPPLAENTGFFEVVEEVQATTCSTC